MAQSAFRFIIEFEDRPVGECWLQEMNLARIIDSHPDADCRRIDLMIGEKDLWGHGIGSRVIDLLSTFGFNHQNADLIFACDVADYNPRSYRAFEKSGFELHSSNPQEPGGKAKETYDLMLKRPGDEAIDPV